MKAVREGKLSETEVKIRDEHACCVIMASKGYPEAYEKGKEITIPAALSDSVIVAGAKLEGERLLTNGGRVLGVIGTADTLKGALDKAYENVSHINFEGAYYRRDIGARALAAMEE
jgi:phosphoribosylamine--glycine ligase